MKLASLKSGRDGQLVVVSRDLSRAVAVTDIAATMQQALDDWATTAPALQARYDELNDGSLPAAFDFDPVHCDAPLPRAYHWADGSAYVTHVELVRKARGAELPESFWHDPLVYMGASDAFIGWSEDAGLTPVVIPWRQLQMPADSAMTTSAAIVGMSQRVRPDFPDPGADAGDAGAAVVVFPCGGA